MIDIRRILGLLHSLALACMAGGVAGCSEELGPERMPVTRVRGTLKERDRPCTKGWVEFFPVDGTIGNLRSARVRADGSFEADRVPVGLNLIRLVDVPLSVPDARHVFGAYTSPIRRTIPPQASAPLVIDVVDEWVKLLASRPRQARAGTSGSGELR